MTSIGFWELALLGIIGLLIMGPERLIRTATDAGRWYGRWQRSFHRIRALVRTELEGDLEQEQSILPGRPAGEAAPEGKTAGGVPGKTVEGVPGKMPED